MNPSRYGGGGSPQRPHTAGPPLSSRDQQTMAQTNGHRQMLPPSPQNYLHRYSPYQSVPNGSHGQNVTRDLPPPPPPPPQLQQTRPSSSMSISSMLGSESDRPSRDRIPPAPSSAASPYNPRPANQHLEMSPPQQLAKSNAQPDPSYLQGSQTPDRMGISNLLGGRPYRSGSGSIMPDARPLEEMARIPGNANMSRYGEAASQGATRRAEAPEHQRRTSISGLLQRPSSQPQEQSHQTYPAPTSQNASFSRPLQSTWPEQPQIQASNPYTAPSLQPNGAPRPADPNSGPMRGQNNTASVSASIPLDTRPPSIFGPQVPQNTPNPQDREPQIRTNTWERTTNSASPDARRQAGVPNQNRAIASLLNGQSQSPKTTGRSQESPQAAPVAMARQDSTQSHGERSSLGDRLDKGRSRVFSPFASSHTSQSMPSGSLASEEKSRKGSDELSQHRAVLALSAAEGKNRGRFSPLPQAVLGAQPQSMVPEVGIKTEQGRIFSGIGGAGPTGAGLNHGPVGLAASPFRKDDSAAFRSLNEDDRLKLTRSNSDMGKKARKLKDEDGRAGSETEGNARAAKKPRNHHHHYRLGNGDLASPLDLQRRNSPLSSLNPVRRTSTPTQNAHHNLHHHHHRGHHHHHHQNAAAQRTYRPSSSIKIKQVVQDVSVIKRRHLGNQVYDPVIRPSTLHLPTKTKLGYAIHPNLIPCFKDPEERNCTYTIRVARKWLRQNEREVICSESSIWGAGIYSDDTDPIAAAIHSGFIKAAWSPSTDLSVLEDVVKTQNPQVDFNENIPDQPVLPPKDKDLHITLLILPALESYPSATRFGLMSREWSKENGDAPHDGVSFLILDCKWVEGGDGRGEERSGAARRKRLAALAVHPPPGMLPVNKD